MRPILLALSLLVAPFAYAAEPLPAGFAPEVWLSTAQPVHGETVEAYTVVYDSSTEPIEGSVTFLINGESIGSTPFTLTPGQTEIRSIRWTAEEGTHVLSARIDTAFHKDTKELANLATRTTASTTIRVSAAPPPREPRVRTASSTSSANLIGALTNAPIIGGAIGAVITTTEMWRASGQETLRNYVNASSTATSTKSGQVLGTSTNATSTPSSSIGESAAKAALPIFIYPIFFYPFFLILLGIGMIMLSKRLTRPQRYRRGRT